jgi:hypothetical protein
VADGGLSTATMQTYTIVALRVVDYGPIISSTQSECFSAVSGPFLSLFLSCF